MFSEIKVFAVPCQFVISGYGSFQFVFGQANDARAAFLGMRKLPLLLAFVAALTAWLWFATQQRAVTMQVRVAAAAPVRTTPQGDNAIFFDMVVAAPDEVERQFLLQVIGPEGNRLVPAGIGEILTVRPDERLRARFALTVSAERVQVSLPLEFQLTDLNEQVVARTQITLPPMK